MNFCLLLLSLLFACMNSSFLIFNLLTNARSYRRYNYCTKQKFVLITYGCMFCNIWLQSTNLNLFILSFCLGHFFWKFCQYCIFSYTNNISYKKIITNGCLSIFCFYKLFISFSYWSVPLLGLLLIPKTFSLFFYSI